jgi:hypothetical protein
LCNEVRGNQARVKNADLRHSSFTVVTQKRKKRKFASPVLNVLKNLKILVTMLKAKVPFSAV